MRKWIFAATGVVIIIVAALCVFIALARAVREEVRDLPGYQVDFAQIQCIPPPFENRPDFLSEVQYLAGMPQKLSVVDDHLASRLAEAFAGHPWVEKVTRVEVRPTHEIEVDLAYRLPVLAVSWRVPHDHGSQKVTEVAARAVDRRGILLPPNAETAGLPLFNAGEQAPLSPAGSPWGSRLVELAALTASFLHLEQPRLGLQSIECHDNEMILFTSAKARILWGHAPGKETRDEAPPKIKLERLLEYIAAHGDLGKPQGPYQHDVRSKERIIRRPLASVSSP
jgi:hypothetical protein